MIRALALLLPQFHPIPENDAWWGKGFTEWTNVSRAKPLFPGHEQPRLPRELGFYDLRLPEAREAQAELARAYGIHGFVYYHYWWAGRRLLERPLAEVLASGKPDFPFAVCWANETWTRRWDGGDKEILVEQVYRDDLDVQFIRELFPLFRDRRYIRVGDRPLLMVYRTELLPDPRRTAARWREACVEAGLPEPYLVRTESFHRCDPADHGFDAAYEFPPLQMPSGTSIDPDTVFPEGKRAAGFTGSLRSYEALVRTMLEREPPAWKCFRGILPGWDNTARVRERATIIVGSRPDLYEEWLRGIVQQTRVRFQGDEQLVFINAWNEWAEGAHLEPDQRHGLAYLEATQRALREQGGELSAFLQQGSAALGDPATAEVWIGQALELLRRQGEELSRVKSQNTDLSRQLLEARAARDPRDLARAFGAKVSDAVKRRSPFRR